MPECEKAPDKLVKTIYQCVSDTWSGVTDQTEVDAESGALALRCAGFCTTQSGSPYATSHRLKLVASYSETKV